MSSNLYQASHQWATRPADERYPSIETMQLACKSYAQSARTVSVQAKELQLEPDGQDLRLLGKTGASAKLTHYAFGQLARLAGAPAEYLRGLSPTLAAENLRYGFRARDDRPLQLLLHTGGDLVTRAITTESYDRVWNFEIIERIVSSRMVAQGWRVPPARPAFAGQPGTRPATQADILPNQADFGLSIRVGDPIAPAGLYASDHDMFMFLVNPDRSVCDGDKQLNRGVFIQNSEVGDCALRFKLFLYDNVCGNHIVWGVAKVMDVSVRHVKGQARARGNTLRTASAKWQIMASGAADVGAMESAIARARTYEIAASKDEVIDAVFKFAKPRSLATLTRGALESAYECAERSPRYGSPRSVWGLVNGLTEVSQKTGHTDQRTELDSHAGRLMEMVF